MYSPTGYYAVFTVRSDGKETQSAFPIVRWDDLGYPLIASPGGQLVRVGEYSRNLEHRMKEVPGGGADDLYINWYVLPHYEI